MAKVYCGECKYFRSWKTTYHHREECIYADNQIEKETVETYRARSRPYTGQAREPAQINAKNECTWYEATDPFDEAIDRDETTG